MRYVIDVNKISQAQRERDDRAGIPRWEPAWTPKVAETYIEPPKPEPRKRKDRK